MLHTEQAPVSTALNGIMQNATAWRSRRALKFSSQRALDMAMNGIRKNEDGVAECGICESGERSERAWKRRGAGE